MRTTLKHTVFTLLVTALILSLLVFSAPGWALDGTPGKILFVDNDAAGKAQIFMINPDGANRVQLTKDPFDHQTPVLSPDGKKLAFYRSAPLDDLGGAGNMGADNSLSTPTLSPEIQAAGIYVSDLDGGHAIKIAGAEASQPVWSPDGNHIWYVSTSSGEASHIYSANVDGTLPKKITNTPTGELRFSLSPDGKQLLYTAIPTEGGSSLQVYIANVDGSGSKRLTVNQGVNKNGLDDYPSWSPDGKYIVYSSYRAGTGSSELYIIDSDGKTDKQLTKHADTERQIVYSPSFSPDGRHVVFASFNDNSINIIDVDGQNLKRLTNGASPVWIKGN